MCRMGVWILGCRNERKERPVMMRLDYRKEHG